uniref:Uncharacterized protein n=1 Tax=Aegilops tauschii subsp. strangulata TaxID=200361 RepID=A0A453KAQ6_AEGTS
KKKRSLFSTLNSEVPEPAHISMLGGASISFLFHPPAIYGRSLPRSLPPSCSSPSPPPASTPVFITPAPGQALPLPNQTARRLASRRAI